jgi:uncharacterized protein
VRVGQEALELLQTAESGSHAWGLPSSDSDYDVRFLQVRRSKRISRVTPLRDVLERPIDATLDVNGWHLRKALGLMLRSNG